MASSIAVTAGDTQPLLTVTLYTDSTLTKAVDLTTATSVVWKFAPSGAEGTAASKTATIATPLSGITTWQHDGTLVEGVYVVHAVITWNDATKETTVGPVMNLTVNAAA